MPGTICPVAGLARPLLLAGAPGGAAALFAAADRVTAFTEKAPFGSFSAPAKLIIDVAGAAQRQTNRLVRIDEDACSAGERDAVALANETNVAEQRVLDRRRHEDESRHAQREGRT